MRRRIGFLALLSLLVACTPVPPATLPSPTPTTVPTATPTFASAPGPTSSRGTPIASPSPTSAPRSATPAASAADLGKLAYVQGGDIWVKELPDGEPQRLTSDGANRVPRWSPSGQWLAFRKGEAQVWVMRADGSEAHPLGDGGGVSSFAWSPTEDRLAYATRSGGLWVVRADGSAPRELIPGPGDQLVAGVGAIAWSPDGQWLAFRWREGRHGAPPTYEGLRRIRADGTALAEIYRTLRPPERYDGIAQVSWSPDGSRLAIWLIPSFSSSLAADGGPLLVVSADGGEAHQIAEAVLPYPEFAVWSPAGDRLAVVAGAGRETWSNKRLVITTPDGRTTWTLSSPRKAVLAPTWSPDGQRLAYVSGPARRVAGGEAARSAMAGRRIWTVRADGSDARQLTDDPAYRDERPLWSADGRYILFVRLDAQNRASLWLIPAAGGAPRQVVGELSPSPGWFGYYGHVAWDELFDWWRGQEVLPQASPQPTATQPAAPSPTPVAGITPVPRPALLDVFPLTVDATWVYSVTLDYAEGGQRHRWTGTITETVTGATQRAGAWVFLVQETGRHPFHTRPEERVFRYVVMGDRLYRLAGGQRTEPLIRSGGAGYEDVLFLRWPMQVGDRWGDPERIARGLPGYTWEVEALETVETPAGRLAECYRLAFRTNPDHQLIWFCPGMGIVRREYHHHGSRYDEVWVLRRFSLSGLAVEDLPGPIHLPSDPNVWTTLERVTDLTGDGQPEIVLSYRLLGASSTTELLVLAPGCRMRSAQHGRRMEIVWRCS